MPYLDSAATSPLLPEARDAMVEAMNLSVAGELGNASSLHHAGHHASEIIEEARAEIAQLINADPSEIIFTSGGTESNNTVMHIFEGQNILVSDIEHPSVLAAAREYGGDVMEWSINDIFTATKEYGGSAAGRSVNGVFKAAASLRASVDDEARNDGPEEESAEKTSLRPASLYSIMLANNELGTIFDIKSLASNAHSHQAYFHTDATQALGKIPIDVKALDVDYLTASAHKIGGPVGIGILYVKNGAPFKPLLVGGHQEKNRRAGTSQVINIAGFGAAANYARTHQTWKIYETKIRPLRDELKNRILKEIPHSSVNTPADSLPNILNVSFAAAEGESIQLYLDLEAETQVSTGSACAIGQPSHVLMAISGGDAEVAHSSIRFSLGLDTTKEDINQVMHHLPEIVRRLQGISTIKIKDQND